MRYQLLILLVLALMGALTGMLFALGDENLRAFGVENSLVETVSMLGYFVCLAAMILLGGWRFAILRVPYITFIVLLMGLRELDLDKQFTTMGIFKSRFYLSSEVSMAEKAVAALFLFFIGWAVIELIEKHWRSFFAGIRRFEPVALSVAFAASLAALAKSIDGLSRKLGAFDVTISERGYLFFQGVEEVLELGIPLLLVVAVLAHFRPWAYGEGS